MEYLFLRRKRNTFGSQRQRDLLFKAAEKILGKGMFRE